VASSTPPADSTRLAATACSRRADRAPPAADVGFPTGLTGRAGPRRGVRAEAGASHDDPLRAARAPATPVPRPTREVLPTAPRGCRTTGRCRPARADAGTRFRPPLRAPPR